MFELQKRSGSNDRECDYWHPPHCNYFRKEMSIGQGLSVLPLTKESTYQSSTKRKRRRIRVRQRKGNGWNGEYCKSSTQGHILALKGNFRQREGRIKYSYQSLERASFRDKFPSLNEIQTGGKTAPYDIRSTE